MIISFDTITFSWETLETGNNLIVMCKDIGTLPADEATRLTYENAIKVVIGKVISGEVS